MLAFLGKEQSHHLFIICRVGGGPNHQVHLPALPHFHDTDGSIISRLVAVKLIAFVQQDGGQRFCGKILVINHLHKFDDIFPLPAEIQGHPHSGVNSAVAGGNKRIVFLQFDLRLVDGLSANLHGGLVIIVAFAVPQQDHQRIVILDQLRKLVVFDANDGKSGVGHFSHLTHRQGIRNGLHTVFQRHIAGHHGGDNFGGQGGKDIRLYPAAQPISQNHDNRISGRLHNLHPVAAQLLAVLVDAAPTQVYAKIIHRLSTPSDWSAQF